MLEFFLFFLWIWLLIVVFSDIFRSHDMGGLAKALWVIFVIIIPYLGVLIYLIAWVAACMSGPRSPGRPVSRKPSTPT